MQNAPRVERFLEPVYLNETMVLNCAAYLFSGVSLETSNTTTQEQQTKAAINAGLPFLSEVIGLSGSRTSATVQQEQSARRFTVGGLHMNVLNALKSKSMIKDVMSLSDQVLDESEILDKYVHVHTILRPSDYWALLEVLRTTGPLLTQVLKDFGDVISTKFGMPEDAWETFEPTLDKYSETLIEVVDRLHSDYLTSGQLEMVMWLSPTERIGIIDLEVAEYDPSALKASLGGGKYHVYGKVTARAKFGQKLSMLQRTTFFEIAELFNRLLAFTDTVAEGDGHGPTETGSELSSQDVREKLRNAVRAINTLISLELPGPAIRISAMSVCV